MRKILSGPWRVFNRLIDPKNQTSRVTLFWLFISAAVFVIVVFGVGIILHVKGENVGTLGDFVGGILNPLLTFLTFMGLLITIVLQQQELTDTRLELTRSATALESQLKSLDRQNFEATFFQMLNLHNTMLGAIDVYRTSTEILHGRDCFRHYFTLFKSEYENSYTEDDLSKIRVGYDEFWVAPRQDLAHYYRYLYNIVRLIDESDVDKIRYIRILRAQISDYELLLLFYNGLTVRGEKFKVYIEKYALFDNLPTDLLLDSQHLELYENTAFDEYIVWRKFSNKIGIFFKP